MRDYSTLHLDMDVNEHERLFNITLIYGCKWTWDYSTLHIDMDVNEHERLFNITLRYGCKRTWETIQHYT